MVSATKTIGPLHLEDLEPHRFEDLVRQLVYDFRPWRMLEATGRAGSDDGFDARGYEIVGGAIALPDDDDDGDESTLAEPDRLWLIQCKREKTIGPTKLVGYLDAIPEEEVQNLHGVVFAAACDFSKTSRDQFRVKARDLGMAEAHIWGRAEIEDQLFQPKNDHLLFAYFGVSLVARRRSAKTELRARLAMKRKAKKLEGFRPVLVRDASDDRYPWLDENEDLSRLVRGRWKVMRVDSCGHNGVRLVGRRHFAFLDDDGEHWDMIEWVNDADLSHEDPWSKEPENHHRTRNAAMKLWDRLPEQNRAWAEVRGVLPYENILDIDFDGDDLFHEAHLFTTPFEDNRPPTRSYWYTEVKGMNQFAPSASMTDSLRVEKFPRECPDLSEDEPRLPVED